MGALRADDNKLEFFSKPKSPHPRTVQRWERRLEALSTSEGFIIHCTLRIDNTKIFYVPEVRDSVKNILARFLPTFVVKLEGDWQESSFLYPHAHLLLPAVSEVRPFLEALKFAGAKVVRSEFQGEVLPHPFTLLPPERGPKNANAWDYISSLPDLTLLGSFVKFPESTISTFKNSAHLARYLAKVTYQGGLKPVIEHNVK
jgi:hypothetical protein